MKKDERQFNGKIEDLPFLGLIILASFNRDEADFIKFAPKYKTPFATNVQTQITLVEELINPKKLTGEMKQLTHQLIEGFTHCRNFVNKVERYLEMAVDEKLSLTMAPADFGIKAIRDAVNVKNDEGVVLHLRTLKQNLADNLTVLATQGYTTEVQTELTTLIKTLSDASVAQTQKKKEREKLVESNIDELNKLWVILSDILKSGKTIYKEIDKRKLKDYTYIEVLKNVQIQRAKQNDDDNTTNDKK